MADDDFTDELFDVPAEITLWGLLVETKSMISRRLDQDVEEAVGIDHPCFEVLLRLGRTPGQAKRMCQLAQEVSFTAGGFTRLADRMERNGLLRREADPLDRRATLLRLTGDGRRILARALAVHVPGVREHLVQHLDPADRAALDRILRHLRAAQI